MSTAEVRIRSDLAKVHVPIQALADLDLIFVSHVVNSDAKQILTLTNSDLNLIRTLANSDPVSKTSLANPDLDFAEFEMTGNRGPN